MTTGIFYAHSGWRYIIILAFVLIIAKALIGWLGKGRWTGLDRGLGLFAVISMDIQFLLGLVLWILRQGWVGANALASWEHPFTMIVALALAHVTWTRVKSAPTDAAKFQTAAIGFLITGIVLALGIARITYVI